MTSKRNQPRADSIEPTVYSPYLMRRHSQKLCEWLEANGVDPGTVSIDYPVSVEGQMIRYTAFVSDDVGRFVVALESGRVPTEERSVPCAVPALTLQAGDDTPE